MVRFGLCAGMISSATDPIGERSVVAAAEAGFDYVELSLSHMASLDEPAFSALAAHLDGAPLRCEAVHNFFPGHLRLTGPNAVQEQALEYARTALARAARLGARVVVFGSAPSKSVPPGFSHEVAWRQLVELCHPLARIAEQAGVTIAIEHNNRQEANIVTLSTDALRLVREVDEAPIQLLVDVWHLERERETSDVVLDAGAALRHVHVAQGDARTFPLELDERLDRFFRHLSTIRYDGRVSVEGFTADFTRDARRALNLLRGLAGRS